MNSADIYNVQFKMKHLNRDFNSNLSGGYCESKSMYLKNMWKIFKDFNNLN